MTRRAGYRILPLLLATALPAAPAIRAMPRASAEMAATPSPIPSRVARWRSFIDEAARRFGVPVDWIAAVMAAESGGETIRNGHPIISRAGAMGLMQVMPATWAAMRGRYGLGRDPHDPRDNILAGTAYLRLMYDRFGYPGLFGAYNAGPGRYADHLASGKPLPAETRAYVARLANRPATSAMPPATLSGERLFFTLDNAKPATSPSGNGTGNPPPTGLFVPLTRAPRGDR